MLGEDLPRLVFEQIHCRVRPRSCRRGSKPPPGPPSLPRRTGAVEFAGGPTGRAAAPPRSGKLVPDDGGATPSHPGGRQLTGTRHTLLRQAIGGERCCASPRRCVTSQARQYEHHGSLSARRTTCPHAGNEVDPASPVSPFGPIVPRACRHPRPTRALFTTTARAARLGRAVRGRALEGCAWPLLFPAAPPVPRRSWSPMAPVIRGNRPSADRWHRLVRTVD
jgi:hypothetical protein